MQCWPARRSARGKSSCCCLCCRIFMKSFPMEVTRCFRCRDVHASNSSISGKYHSRSEMVTGVKRGKALKVQPNSSLHKLPNPGGVERKHKNARNEESSMTPVDQRWSTFGLGSYCHRAQNSLEELADRPTVGQYDAMEVVSPPHAKVEQKTSTKPRT